MMHNNELAARYPDLLPSNAQTHGENQHDPDLLSLIADLESTCMSESVPPHLEERIASALTRRAAHMRPARPVSRPRVLHTNELDHVRPGFTTGGAATMKPKRISTIAASVAAFVVVALIAILLYSSHGSGTTGTGGETFQQRLSELGGTQLVLAAAAAPGSQAISADILTIERRLATQINSSDMYVFADSPNNHLTNVIVVEIAGHTANAASIASLVGSTGHLDIIDTGSTLLTLSTDVTGETCTSTCAPGQYKIVFTGDEFDPNSIQAISDPPTNQPAVQFEFRGAAQSAFATYTQNNIGNYLTITLDNKVIECATIESQISGLGQISGGNFTTLAQAQNLATLLKYGALPAPVTVIVNASIQPGAPLPTISCQTVTPGGGSDCFEHEVGANGTVQPTTTSPTITPGP
ncbi:MAG: SecDF P1 head subdomain-containing protein [Ktedonobacterales bacterium]